MVVGIIILFIVVCLSGAEKRRGRETIFMKIHIPAMILLALVMIAHIIFIWQLIDVRLIPILNTGLITAVFILFAMISELMNGKAGTEKVQAKIHRLAMPLASVFIILHSANYFAGVLL